MLTKAANHLRPFIRVPSQPLSTPEHFTANPSLLHHLPQNGVGHSLITQTSSSTSSAGQTSGPGAGRSGYSAGNSGYTGHARTFLSFQHGTGIDGSSSVSTIEEEKKKQALKGRYEARRTKLVVIPDGRRVRKELEGRQGVTVNVISETSQRGSVKTIPDRPRRSSIAFPTPPTPRVERPEIWQVGITRPRQLRHLSTRNVVQRVPAPETRVLTPPNRVMMDLAGHSEPVIKLGGVRRNSVSTMERIPETPVYIPEKPVDLDQPNQERDFRHALSKAVEVRKAKHVKDLIAHYRSPRVVSPFDQSPSSFSISHPLPNEYTVHTYNACLSALLEIRQRGEAIVQILDIYNEMLSRDIMPNVETYSLVIKALCYREIDIGSAVRQHENYEKWAQWQRRSFNLPEVESKAEEITGYKREGNLSSAFKLFRAAVLFLPKGSSFQTDVFRALLEGSAASPTPDIEGSLEVLKYAISKSAPGYLTLYASIIESLGKTRDLTRLNEIWTEFVSLPKGQERDWISKQGTTVVIPQKIRQIWQYAIVAFVQSGDIPKAVQLMETIVAAEPTTQSRIEQNLPIRATQLVFGEFINALAAAGEVDMALDWYDRSKSFVSDTAGTEIPFTSINKFLDSLILAGRLDEATAVFNDMRGSKGYEIERSVYTKIYNAHMANPIESTLSFVQPLIPHLEVRKFPTPVFQHVRLLLQANRFDEITPLLNELVYKVAEHTPIPENIINHPLSLPQRLELVRALHSKKAILSPESALTIWNQYLTERDLVSSPLELNIDPRLWYRMISVVGGVSNNRSIKIDTPPLIRFVQDLAIVKSTYEASGEFTLENSRDALILLYDRLQLRFGRETALEIIDPIGEVPGITRMASKVARVSPAESLIEFSLPPTPDSLPSPLYTIDNRLSAQIDAHLGSKASLSPAQAYSVIQANLKENKVPHAETISRLLVTFSRTNDEPKVRELYELASTVLQCTPEAYQPIAWAHVENAMCIACCHLGHLEQAGMHRARLVENGMAPSADAYASMIANSKDTTDDALVARELYAESQALGVRPTLYLYNTIISKLSKARKAESALELFVQMKAAGCRPSSVTYGAVINACCRVGDAESAATLFDEMSSMPNFKPRVPPFNTMMQFHLQTRPSREHVLHYYNALRAVNVPPSAHTYKLLLDTYSVLPPIDLEQMERVFSDLCADRSVQVQGTHWASLITAYGIHANNLPKALEIFNSIPSHPSTRPGYTPEPVVWEAILTVIAQKGTLAELEQMRQRMIDSGSHATAYVYNVLITAYASTSIDKSREIFESMADSYVGVAAPNNHPTLLTSSGQVKPATVTPTPTHVVYREPSTYEAMIRAEVVAGDRARAEDVLGRMEERRYPVAVFMRARAILDEPLDV